MRQDNRETSSNQRSSHHGVEKETQYDSTHTARNRARRKNNVQTESYMQTQVCFNLAISFNFTNYTTNNATILLDQKTNTSSILQESTYRRLHENRNVAQRRREKLQGNSRRLCADDGRILRHGYKERGYDAPLGYNYSHREPTANLHGNRRSSAEHLVDLMRNPTQKRRCRCRTMSKVTHKSCLHNLVC
jgi:hypothetical protein